MPPFFTLLNALHPLETPQTYPSSTSLYLPSSLYNPKRLLFTNISFFYTSLLHPPLHPTLPGTSPSQTPNTFLYPLHSTYFRYSLSQLHFFYTSSPFPPSKPHLCKRTLLRCGGAPPWSWGPPWEWSWWHPSYPGGDRGATRRWGSGSGSSRGTLPLASPRGTPSLCRPPEEVEAGEAGVCTHALSFLTSTFLHLSFFFFYFKISLSLSSLIFISLQHY